MLEWEPYLLFQLVLILSCLTLGWLLGMMTVFHGPWTQTALRRMVNGAFFFLLVLLIAGILL